MAQLPVGTIIWWPSAASPPAGWHVCDGTSGTPNLTDKTVPGAGRTYAVGDSGGSFTLPVPAHAHGVGSIDLPAFYGILGANVQGAHGHQYSYATDTNSDTPPAPPIPVVVGSTTQGLLVGHAHTGSLDTTVDPAFSNFEVNANNHNHPVTGDSDVAAAPALDINVKRVGLYFIQRLS